MACHVIGAIVYCVSSSPIKRITESSVLNIRRMLSHPNAARYLCHPLLVLRVCSPKLNAYSGQIFIFSAHIVAIIGNVCTTQLKAQ